MHFTDKKKEQIKEIVFSIIGIMFLLAFFINNLNFFFSGEVTNFISLKNLIVIICGGILTISSGSYDFIRKTYRKSIITISDGARIFLAILGFLALATRLVLIN